jgi:Holliday junction resolvasome RuvABC endonuclease subunit
MRHSKLVYNTVLAMDMGSKNTSMVIMSVCNNKIKIRSAKMVPNTINDLNKNLLEQTNKFKSILKENIKKYNPNSVICERYMARFKGSESEKVNIMLGIIISVCEDNNIPIELKGAAAWKNVFTKKFHSKTKLEKLYKTSRQHIHLIDAMLMAMFKLNVLDRKIFPIAKKIWLKPGMNGKPSRHLTVQLQK